MEMLKDVKARVKRMAAYAHGDEEDTLLDAIHALAEARAEVERLTRERNDTAASLREAHRRLSDCYKALVENERKRKT